MFGLFKGLKDVKCLFSLENLKHLSPALRKLTEMIIVRPGKKVGSGHVYPYPRSSYSYSTSENFGSD